ncbi:MAG: HIT domain-containing protein [Thioalkalivibrionaceae bacterium]
MTLPPWCLDPSLAAETCAVADGPVSALRLHHAVEVEWWILVPRVPAALELCDLSDEAAQILLTESLSVQRALRRRFPSARLNVGKLGNVVAQLHVHHVVRSADDVLWPGPVWGRVGGARRSQADIEQRVEAMKSMLAATSPTSVNWRWCAAKGRDHS